MLRLAHGRFVIEVRGPAAPLAWLEEFLAGPFVPTEAPPARAVALRLDPADYAARAQGPTPEEVDAFTRDGSFERLPARREGDVLVLHDAGRRVAYEVGREVAVVAPEDGFSARLALLRVARELATAAALARGRLHLHAAGAAVRGGIVALAGPRRSGKSTLLLHALLAGSARYVANDRLLVDPEDGAARGVPTLVRLRPETLDHFPGLAARLRVRGYDRAFTLAEIEAGARAEAAPSLSPAQLRALTGAGARGAGPLRALVFPEVSRGPGFDVAPLDAAEGARRLGGALLLAGLPERPPAAWGDAPARGRAALDALCADLAARVACLRVRLGPGAYAGRPAVWDALAERL